jgi:hypothetical protein
MEDVNSFLTPQIFPIRQGDVEKKKKKKKKEEEPAADAAPAAAPAPAPAAVIHYYLIIQL